MANWGVGIGAFADGIVRGMSLGRQVKDAWQQGEIDKLTRDGLEQAKVSRQQQVDGAVQAFDKTIPGQTDMNGGGVLANPAAAGIETKANPNPSPIDGLATTAGDVLGLPKEAAPLKAAKKAMFKVGDREFDTEADARKAAEADAAPLMDFFMRDAAPKIRDTYIAQGKIEQAERFGSWIEESNTKAGMRAWSQAVSAAQLGNYETAAKKLVKAYNTPGYFDDGYEAVDAEIVKDDKGNVTGFRVKVKGKDGKEYTQDYANTEDMLAVGLGMLSPQARFDAIYKESLAAKKAKLESAAELAKEGRQEAKEFRKIKYNAEVDARLESFKSSLRKSEESHKAQYKDGPGGKGEYRASRSPEDLAGDIQKILMDDYNFKRLPPAEQQAEIWRQVQAVYPNAKPGQSRNVVGGSGVPLLDLGD